MNPHIEKLYKDVRRFDEGELYQSVEYKLLSRRRMEHHAALCKILGPQFSEEFSKFLEQMDEEIEYECLHFFAEGYFIGRAEGKEEAFNIKH